MKYLPKIIRATSIFLMLAIQIIPHASVAADNCQRCPNSLGKSSFFDNITARVDFLWWRAEEDELALGKEVQVSRSGLNQATHNYALVTKDTKEKNLDFIYSPGFRIGLSYIAPACCWDLALNWIHYNTTAHASGQSDLITEGSNPDTYLAFVPFWESLSQEFPSQSKGKWWLDLDVLDLEVGYNFDLGSNFICRPSFGLRLANIDQHYHIESKNSTSGEFNGTSYDYTSKSKARCNFLGIGPRVGLDASLDIGCGFSFFGEAAAAVLLGKFERNTHQSVENADYYYFQFNTYQDNVHNNKNDWCSRAATDLSVGLAWNYDFTICQKVYPTGIALSWEHHTFYNLNNFNVESNSFMSNGFTNTSSEGFDFGPFANLFPTCKKHGDLYTQGLTLSAEIGF